MGLEEASNLGTIQDIISQIQLFWVLVFLVSPIIIFLLTIIIIRLVKNILKWKASKRKHMKKLEEERKKKIKAAKKHRKQLIDKAFQNEKYMMHKLDNIVEPIDKSAYHDLDITFGKDGKTIGGK